LPVNFAEFGSLGWGGLSGKCKRQEDNAHSRIAP
jgi:hypothetical protein